MTLFKNESEPGVFNKYLVSLTKIVAFYCFFFVLVKSIAIALGAWFWPNILITAPFVFLGIFTAFTAYFQRYNWITAIFGAVFIVVMRVFEHDIVYYLQGHLGS